MIIGTKMKQSSEKHWQEHYDALQWMKIVMDLESTLNEGIQKKNRG